MKKIIALIALASCTNTFSTPIQNPFWQDVEESAFLQQNRIKINDLHALKKRSLSLNERSLKQHLFDNTGSFTGNKRLKSLAVDDKPSPKEIDLPLPSGAFVRVSVIDSPILSKELALSHPDIKTWSVVGVDDPAISGRIDFTRSGFHAMLILADGETIFIDPDKNESTDIYHSLSKRENASHFDIDFNCEIHGKHSLISKNNLQASTKELPSKKLEKLAALELIDYRLAIAGTAEYTSTLGGKGLAYDSMVTTINRVNQIYQRDLGVKLTLVSDEALLYTNAATDPYTNNVTTALVTENMASLHPLMGSANYDIGHVFATGVNAGLAYKGVACLNQANVGEPGNYVNVTGIKAGGASGFVNPQGEIFSINLVAHEIGHQLGADHTFNGLGGSCGGNITEETAVEPGGGSTIMSYSGSCGADSFQLSPDAMFHWKSIFQINEYTRDDSVGNSCGTRTSTGHQAPVANAGANHVIPVNTPFLLDGEAIAGNATYSWDQMDAGTASAVDVDKGDNAIIRALYPTASPDRYIPRLSDLFTGGSTEGEILPQTVRNLNFSFVVRDSNGEVGNDLKLISTENTGASFKVLSHNLNETLSSNQSTTVSWDVASTTNAPISCAKIDIKLLRVSGQTNDLLLNTDNDGSEIIAIPAITPSMTNARIMVACATQPFFQISSGNIAIQQIGDSTPPVITITGESSIDVFQTATYSEEGATATDNVDGTVTVSPSGTVNTAVVGTYTITYTATDSAGNTATKVRTVKVIADIEAPTIVLSGANSIEVIKDSTYIDAGATAVDNLDANKPATKTGTVDSSTVGEYTITYSATDKAGNIATEVIRTVNVIGDTKAPVITLAGDSTVSIFKGQTYTDAGATAIDNADGSVSVSVSGTVDTSTLGSYTITYSATDSVDNTATATRIVNVILDTVAPVIKLNGGNTTNITEGFSYNDAGATALDDKDGEVSVESSGIDDVDTSKVDTYIVTYTATDEAGNTSTKTRTINVLAKNGDDNSNDDDDGNSNDNGNALKGDKSSGGSMGFLLFPMALLGLRRRFVKFKIN